MCWFALPAAAAATTATAATAATATAASAATTLGIANSTWATLGTIGQVAGLGFQAISAMNNASATQQAAEYNAAVQRNNATVAEWQAQDAIQRGDQAVEDHARKVAALKGTQTASMAARGLDISEGSALNILTDTDLFGEIDKNTIRNNADREAWAFRNQGANYNAQATLSSAQGRSQNPLLAGATTLLSGAGTVADKWYRYKTGNTGITIG